MRIQLLSFPGCPNVGAAREMLCAVLASAQIDETVEEVDTTSPDTPETLRGWGSPTILVNGRDVGGQEAPSGAGCRIYRDEAGSLCRTPPVALLRAALVVAA